MRGIWTWPAGPKDQDKTMRRIMQEDELAKILFALAESPQGLSNAELDRFLSNNSQWRTLPHMKELMALGLVGYHVQFFGEPGKYEITDRGRALTTQMQTNG